MSKAFSLRAPMLMAMLSLLVALVLYLQVFPARGYVLSGIGACRGHVAGGRTMQELELLGFRWSDDRQLVRDAPRGVQIVCDVAAADAWSAPCVVASFWQHPFLPKHRRCR